MSYHRTNGSPLPTSGLGATFISGAQIEAVKQARAAGGGHMVAPPPGMPVATVPGAPGTGTGTMGGIGLSTVLIVGGIGVAGYLLLRHFRKKTSSTSSPPPPPSSTP